MLTFKQTTSHYLQNKSFIFFNRKNSHKTSPHFHKNNTQNTYANTLKCNTFFYISINLKVVPFLFMVYIIFIRNLRLNLVLSINIMPMENTDTIFKRKKSTKRTSPRKFVINNLMNYSKSLTVGVLSLGKSFVIVNN